MHFSVSWGIFAISSKVTSALVARHTQESVVYGNPCSLDLGAGNAFEGQQQLEGTWLWKVGTMASRDCRLYVSLKEVNVIGEVISLTYTFQRR